MADIEEELDLSGVDVSLTEEDEKRLLESDNDEEISEKHEQVSRSESEKDMIELEFRLTEEDEKGISEFLSKEYISEEDEQTESDEDVIQLGLTKSNDQFDDDDGEIVVPEPSTPAASAKKAAIKRDNTKSSPVVM